MKKKYFNLVVFLLLILSGCGSNTYPTVNPVSVEADTIQTKETEITEKEEPKIAEPEEIEPEIAESEDEEVAEEEEPETKKLEYATLSEMDKLKPKNLLTEVTDEAKEEYERRQSEGIVYEPEIIISDYTGYSDAEIIDIVNKRYLELHNNLRSELGLSTFTETNGMRNVATIRAEEISYFWSHTRPDGSWGPDIVPWDGVSYQEVGENIALISGSESNFKGEGFYKDFADRGFNLLCNSPSHYENMTKPGYKVIGIDSCIVRYKDYIIVYTAFEFATC